MYVGVRVIGLFQFIMSVDDSFDAGEFSVGFVLDPGGVTIDMDRVVVVVVATMAEHVDGFVFAN